MNEIKRKDDAKKINDLALEVLENAGVKSRPHYGGYFEYLETLISNEKDNNIVVWEPSVNGSFESSVVNDFDEILTLEDYGPYPNEFYPSLALLLVKALTPETTNAKSTTESAQIVDNDETKKKSNPSLDLLERNDLRGIRILKQFLHFPPRLLNLSLLFQSSNENNLKKKNSQDDNTNSNILNISLLVQALMKYINALPDLELYIRSIQRSLYQAPFSSTQAEASKSNTTSSTLHVSSTSNSYSVTNTSSSTISASIQDRQEHMKQIHNISTSLDQILSDHLKSCEYILGQIYSHCKEDQMEGHANKARMQLHHNRSFMKLKIGTFLHSFPLTYQHRRNKGVHGMTNMSKGKGIENTTACGIEMMLWILYRIICGSPLPYKSTKSSSPAISTSESSKNAIYDQLLHQVLLPLHKPNEMILWRDQTPLISLYHEPLVLCIVELCQRMATKPTLSNEPSLTAEKSLEHHFILQDSQLLTNLDVALLALLDLSIWPLEYNNNSNNNGAGVAANTPKVVLLLHEFNTILEQVVSKFRSNVYRRVFTGKEEELSKPDNANLDSCSFPKVQFLAPLMTRLCAYIQGDNSRTSERAMEFFKSNVFCNLVKQPQYLPTHITPLMRALCRVEHKMELAWNPTVNKMVKLVLNKLEDWDKDLFVLTANTMFRKAKDNDHSADYRFSRTSKDDSDTAKRKSNSIPIGVQRAIPLVTKQTSSTYSMASLKTSMGGWKPPTTAANGNIRSNINKTSSPLTTPPLTVTGIAPWAVSPSSSSNFQRSRSKKPSFLMPPPSNRSQGHGLQEKNNSTNDPSITFNPLPPKNNVRPFKKQILSSSSPLLNATTKNQQTLTASNDEMKKVNDLKSESQQNFNKGISLVREYMQKLTPHSNDEDRNIIDHDGNPISSWARAQVMESPVLMPNLKFHDLVFRHEDIGKGAFSTVKYARLILKSKTRSHWPEYAVKVVSTQKINELGYSFAINREISILSELSHPNIARLISSFRFRDGAYLILEYASKGDLYSILRRDGSLDHKSAQFVIGEIVAALNSIHELGFVYSDLKPENILLAESGHIKLTDFGGCRAVSEEAKGRLRKKRHLWKHLRDGDWREANSFKNETDRDDAPDKDDEVEDCRIEGTTAYLPPEVALGNIPTPAADVWALGCVLFQCLAGRPPIFEDSNAETMQKIVTFRMEDHSSSSFFGENEKDKKVFEPETKDLITKLLSRSMSERPSMEVIATHNFFRGLASSVFSLYTLNPAPKLNVGQIAPTPNAKWSRRQYSSIWAPQPKSYGKESNMKIQNIHCNGDVEALRHVAIEESEEWKTFFLPKTRMFPMNPRNARKTIIKESHNSIEEVNEDEGE